MIGGSYLCLHMVSVYHSFSVIVCFMSHTPSVQSYSIIFNTEKTTILPSPLVTNASLSRGRSAPIQTTWPTADDFQSSCGRPAVATKSERRWSENNVADNGRLRAENMLLSPIINQIPIMAQCLIALTLVGLGQTRLASLCEVLLILLICQYRVNDLLTNSESRLCFTKQFYPLRSQISRQCKSYN